jgi:hypothetical protein
MIREAVDFNAIEPRFREIHERLENWARTLRSPGHAEVHPMFRLYRTDNFHHEISVSIGVDTHDAHKIDKGVRELPQDHRVAIQWFYVRPTSPRKVRQLLGVTNEGLDKLVRNGRIMLVNRRI